MKYIDFESWTITWLHEGNVIVEDQLTHNFKRGSRTAPPKAVFYAAVWAECEQNVRQNVSRNWQWFCSKMPLTLTSRFMETWLVEVKIVSLLWFTFLFIVLWNVLGVQPIIWSSRFCSGVLKIQRIEEFSLGLERNGMFRKICSSASCP